ncbi:DedA family protein [Streptomyces axinellae]|uniref:VTT domain-containing protein n=1 Tax=Streptomyces axinellae TaxID=552788 RepID=A0ABP6C002_9ACTN
MPEILGTVTGSPWIYAVIAASVLLDVFVPLLPSGVLVIAAATAAAGTTAADAADLPSAAARHATGGEHYAEIALLVLCAAVASVLGDLVAWRLAWRGGARFDRAIARSRRLVRAQEKLGQALTRGGGALVVLARFAPAGRSVVSLTAGAAHRSARDFVPWSALAGLAWAAYSVGLGCLGGQWLGASWLGTVVSVFALFAAGGLAAFLIRRDPEREPVDEQSTAAGDPLPPDAPAPAPTTPAFAVPALAAPALAPPGLPPLSPLQALAGPASTPAGLGFPLLPSMRAPAGEGGLLPAPASPTPTSAAPTETPTA